MQQLNNSGSPEAKELRVQEILSLLGSYSIPLDEKDSNDNTIFMLATKSRNKKLFESLLQCRNVPVNQKNRLKDAPIHELVGQCDYEMLKMLITYPGVDLNAKNKNDKRAIDLAEENHNTQCAVLLRKAMEDRGIAI